MNSTDCTTTCEDASVLQDEKAQKSFSQYVSHLWHQVKHGFILLKPYLKNPKVLITVSLPVLILLLVTVFWCMTRGNNGFITYRQNIEIVDLGDDIHIFVDDKLLTDKLYDREADSIKNSLDGQVAAFLTSKKELYAVNGKHLKHVADNVVCYELSTSGAGLIYAVQTRDTYCLTLYNVEKQEALQLSDKVSSTDFAISPNGRSAAYYVGGKGGDLLTYSDGSKTVTVTYDNSDLIGLSDKGKYIYAISKQENGEDRLYCYNTRGKREKLGTVTTASMKFNDDHSQLMFYNNGTTYISVKGKEGVKASSNALYLVTVPNSRSMNDTNAITYPVASLFDHVYTCSDGIRTTAWLIQKNPKRSELLVSDVSGCTLDASAKYLYYIYNSDELRWVKISHGADASDRCKTVAQNVDTYVLTGDRGRVYYTNNRVLYSCNGKNGKSNRILTDKELGYTLCISRSDVAFFTMDGNLYTCKNGKKITMVLSSPEGVFQSANGAVYAYADGGFHSIYRSGKLRDVLQYDQ